MALALSNVMIIDDDRDFSASLVQLLEVENHTVTAYYDPVAALRTITAQFNGVVLLDVRMPRASGEDVLKQLQEIDRSLPVILITGHGDIPMAVRALKHGAYGFFTKPLQLDEFMHDIQRAQAARSVEIERRKLARQLEARNDLLDIVVGTSPKMAALRLMIAKIGSTSVDVLIRGETGSGKEVVAHALASISFNEEAPFIAVNCGNLNPARAAEELFGTESVTPSGEKSIVPGYFERANGGTLLLDEVESMPADIQVRLLRVLQERSLERVNGQDSVNLDIRILTATKSDLQILVKNGQFREDLYYRLNGVTLVVPPLRERGADSVILFERFLQQQSGQKNAHPTLPLTPDLMSNLLSHDWPGNVRELKNAANRYAAGLYVFGEDEPGRSRSDSLSMRVSGFEKSLIESTLAQNKGSIKRTMLDLDIPRKTLQDKLNKYGLNRDDYSR